MQDAVNAVADDELILLRLDMNVARALLRGGEDHGVDEAHERCVRNAVVGLEVVLTLLVDGGDVADVARVHRLGCARKPANLRHDIVLGRDEELDREARRQAELV